MTHCMGCGKRVYAGDRNRVVRVRRSRHPKTLWHVACWDRMVDGLLDQHARDHADGSQG